MTPTIAPVSGNILLMDDVRGDVCLFADELEKDDFCVDYVSSIQAAIESFKVKQYDVAILDALMEPGMLSELKAIFKDDLQADFLIGGQFQDQGFAVAKWLREYQPEVGVIMLTGVFTDEEHTLLGLESGADDYVSKSKISAKQLSARVRALLRRCQPFSKEKISSAEFDLFVKPQKIVSRSGEATFLTDAEFMALRLLMRNADRSVTREKILEHANLDYSQKNSLRAADTLISKIRDKLTRCGVSQSVIRTHRGRGYVFDLHAVRMISGQNQKVIAENPPVVHKSCRPCGNEY